MINCEHMQKKKKWNAFSVSKIDNSMPSQPWSHAL